MNYTELLRASLRAIRAHTLRSFLTLLGVIIGVATIVAVVGVISGLNAFVKEKIIILAPDVFIVQKFGIIRSREEFIQALKRPPISWQEYERLFLSLMASRKIEEKIDRALFETPTVLLCSEHTAENCHRRLVLEYLQDKWGDVGIIHL